MKNIKSKTLFTQDIKLRQEKRIKKNIKKNINISTIINEIQEYFYSIKEIFLYYLSFFINLFNNFIIVVTKKRKEEIIFIKGNGIKNLIRKDYNKIKESK